MPSTDSVRELLIEELNLLYDAVKQRQEALPKAIALSGSAPVLEQLKIELEQTARHLGRLERSFEILNQRLSKRRCYAMDGLLRDWFEPIIHRGVDPIRDAKWVGG
jgi:ferritin-like metal-binding protein YciE